MYDEKLGQCFHHAFAPGGELCSQGMKFVSEREHWPGWELDSGRYLSLTPRVGHSPLGVNPLYSLEEWRNRGTLPQLANVTPRGQSRTLGANFTAEGQSSILSARLKTGLWGPFLTLPLGANFDPRGEVVPQGKILSPGGEFCPLGPVKLSPGGELLCSPLHSSKQ
jgi:hypothetical protein